MKIRRRAKFAVAAAVIFLVVLLSVVRGVYRGDILLNHPLRSRYPIRGVDVSHYQGEIDWRQLSQEDIRFAYIKATEGSSYQDETFSFNWKAASASGVLPDDTGSLCHRGSVGTVSEGRLWRLPALDSKCGSVS